jgi:heme a synthase
MLHRFSKLVAACTILLILAGSLVTSHGAGLSVPDWPTSYGWNMFTFPPSMWVANILYEHGHRLIASGVGVLTILLVICLWTSDQPRWLRWFGTAALGAIVAQGLLGGLTVLFFLPAAVSTAHAALAEIFFGMMVSVALFTSPRWIAQPAPVDDVRLRHIAAVTLALVYCQILVGATMRHTGAGLAIPDFPWMFGHVVPDHWSAAIAIHFAHRVGAAIVAIAILSTAGFIWRQHADRPDLLFPARLLVLLLFAQASLGASVVLSGLQPWVNSAHVVVGASVLAAALVVTLRSWQARFAEFFRHRMDERPGNPHSFAGEIVLFPPTIHAFHGRLRRTNAMS